MDGAHPESSTIRWAAPGDVAALRDVYRRASLSNEGDRDLLTRHPELLEWSDAAVRQGRTRVAVWGDQIVGFATVAPGETVGEVEDLFVDPEWMRRGIGRALVDDLVDVARAQGMVSIEVDANPEALAFYLAVGFVSIGESVLAHGTGVRMRLEIDA